LSTGVATACGIDRRLDRPIKLYSSSVSETESSLSTEVLVAANRGKNRLAPGGPVACGGVAGGLTAHGGNTRLVRFSSPSFSSSLLLLLFSLVSLFLFVLLHFGACYPTVSFFI
jgi:hypothetical protein